MGSTDISTLLQVVRGELEKADNSIRKAGRKAILALESVQLELKVVVSEDANVEGGFDLKIVKFGASLAGRQEEVQTITVKYSVSEAARTAGVPGTRAHSRSGRGGEKDITSLPPAR